MKKNLTKNKKLGIIACLSVIFAFGLGIGTLVYYFAPRGDKVETITVPDFVGTYENTLFDTDELEIKREWVYSDDEQKGKVISQTPHANARRKLKSGEKREVTVYIGLGEKENEIPDLVGVDEISAAKALRELGARVRSVAIYGGEGEDGIVTGTSPDAASRIKSGDTVTLFVSRRRLPREIIIPDFVGMSLEKAASIALSIGLSLNVETDLEGEVKEQSIPQGARVPAGSYISFKTDGGEREWPPLAGNDLFKEDF